MAVPLESTPVKREFNLNPVTGLPNLKEFGSQAQDLVRWEPGKFSVIYGDVDGLKTANDGPEGHEGGNNLLKAFSDNLLQSTELAGVSSDNFKAKVYHIHGDEFVIISGCSDPDELRQMTSRLEAQLDEMGTPASLGGQVHKPGMSVNEMLSVTDDIMRDRKAERKEQKRKAEYKALPRRKRAAYLASRLLGKYSGMRPAGGR